MQTATDTGDSGSYKLAQFRKPENLYYDSTTHSLYICGNQKIRVVNLTSSIITTVAGVSSGGDTNDNVPALTAAITCNEDGGITVHNGVVFFGQGARLRKVENGMVTTIAGSTTSTGYTGDGGLAINALLNIVSGLIVDRPRNILYIGMQNGNPSRIRQVNLTSNIISTVDNPNFAGLFEFDEEKKLLYHGHFEGRTFYVRNITSGVRTHILGRYGDTIVTLVVLLVVIHPILLLAYWQP